MMKSYGINVDSISRVGDVESLCRESELAYLSEQARDKEVIIEVGSWRGASAMRMAESCSGLVYCVDHWMGNQDDAGACYTEEATRDPLLAYRKFLAYTSHLGFLGNNLVPMLGTSGECAMYFNDNSVDLVFIDGGHLYQQVMADCVLLYPKLKQEGILLGHDWHFEQVQPAVKEFARVNGLAYDIPNDDWAGIWRIVK